MAMLKKSPRMQLNWTCQWLLIARGCGGSNRRKWLYVTLHDAESYRVDEAVIPKGKPVDTKIPRTGQYEDGTLGEVFIDMHKEGAAFRSLEFFRHRSVPRSSVRSTFARVRRRVHLHPVRALWNGDGERPIRCRPRSSITSSET